MTNYSSLLDAIEARLREMQARTEAATPGPWRVCEDDGLSFVCRQRDADHVGLLMREHDGSDCDTAFAAHARTDLPALVGWALEWAAICRESMAALGDTADEVRLRTEAHSELSRLARALGIHGERG